MPPTNQARNLGYPDIPSIYTASGHWVVSILSPLHCSAFPLHLCDSVWTSLLLVWLTPTHQLLCCLISASFRVPRSPGPLFYDLRLLKPLITHHLHPPHEAYGPYISITAVPGTIIPISCHLSLLRGLKSNVPRGLAETEMSQSGSV
jgi:hypothetical protein